MTDPNTYISPNSDGQICPLSTHEKITGYFPKMKFKKNQISNN